MNEAVFCALKLLYNHDRRRRRPEAYLLERDDRALSDLVANSHRTGDPQRLVRDARRNASKLLRRRARIAPVAIAGEDVVQDADEDAADEATSAEMPDALLEVRERLARVRLTPNDEAILQLLAQGCPPAAIAMALRCTPEQARLRVYRARARFLAQWEAV